MSHYHPSTHNGAASHLELEITQYFMGSACPHVEHHVGGTPGVQNVSLNRVSGVILVDYNPTQITPDGIIEAVKHCGFICREGGAEHAAAHTGHAEHAAHEGHEGHDAHAGHGPHMATMMRNMFFIAAAITIVELLYSPLGTRLLGLNPATPFGIPNTIFQFLLTTPIVFWGGKPFLSVAWKALLKGELNMATLIATGILTAYLYSVGATFLFDGDVFYARPDRVPSRQDRVKQRPEGIQIAGEPVTGRSRRRPEAGPSRGVAIPPPKERLSEIADDQLCQPVLLGNQDVAGMQRAVKEPGVMDTRQRPGKSKGDPFRQVLPLIDGARKRRGGHQLAQALPLDPFAHDDVPGVLIVEGGKEPGHPLGLGHEPDPSPDRRQRGGFLGHAPDMDGAPALLVDPLVSIAFRFPHEASVESVTSRQHRISHRTPLPWAVSSSLGRSILQRKAPRRHPNARGEEPGG